MYLTSIKLNGFKSFAEPTTIKVPEKLVAVVGPNGCGKSNVIDAVRWVLGESSAKQLRGESMQDVIFNGSTSRRPAPRASVELVFDNHDGLLQGMWGQYSEISIKRQLDRQGDSLYYINNQQVRKRDITDLFLGTGVGTRGYAIIEQGMISRIIEARPEELRSYLEEAAGISKYKERRRETENRLKDSREHLHRLSDLQSELVRQINKLTSQAQVAAQYQQLQKELQDWQNWLAYLEWQSALQEADQAAAYYTELHNQVAEQQNQIDELSHQLSLLREQTHQQQALIHSQQNQYTFAREQIVRFEEQIKQLNQAQQRLEKERLQAQAQIHHIQQQQFKNQENLELITLRVEEYRTVHEEYTYQAAQIEIKLPEIESALHNIQQSRQAVSEQRHDVQKKLALKIQQQSYYKLNIEQHHLRQSRLSDELLSLEIPTTESIVSIQNDVARLENQLHECQTLLEQQETNWQTDYQEIQSLQEQQHRYQYQLTTIQAQIQATNALLTQEVNQYHWSESVNDLMLPEPLWKYIHIDELWRYAISTVLSKRVNAYLVQPSFTQPNQQPEHSLFWCYDNIPQGSISSDSVLQHVTTDRPEIYTILSHWLGHIRCSPSLETAIRCRSQLEPHQIWLTPEGHYVDISGVCFLTTTHTENQFQQLAQLNHWTEEITQIQSQLEKIEDAIAVKQTQLDALHQHKLQLQKDSQEYQANLQAASTQYTRLITQQQQITERKKSIQQELDSTKENIDKNQESLQESFRDIELLENQISSLETHYSDIDKQYLEMTSQLKHERETLQHIQRQIHSSNVEQQKIQQEYEYLLEQKTLLSKQQEDWLNRQEELALSDNLTEQIERQFQQLNHQQDELALINERIHHLQTTLKQTQDTENNIIQQQQTLQHQLPLLREKAQEYLLQQQKYLLSARQFHDMLINNHADIDMLSQTKAPIIHHQQLKNQIDTTHQKILSLGHVNLVATDELNAAVERNDYYTSQINDIESAIQLLEDAINQIDTETKQRFKNTFDEVNAQMKTLFPILFGGGDAYLELTDSEWLHAGISIMARPPGKKNTTIHLLSGGEKTLTAMSLVFALFSLNPAPFCLLDEVDAPLDDANTARFCQLVQKMSAHTQFLYISHNRITMEIAQQLIGITMQEKGVSRVVSVDIQQATNMLTR